MPLGLNPNPSLDFQTLVPNVLAQKPSRLGTPETHQGTLPALQKETVPNGAAQIPSLEFSTSTEATSTCGGTTKTLTHILTLSLNPPSSEPPEYLTPQPAYLVDHALGLNPNPNLCFQAIFPKRPGVKTVHMVDPKPQNKTPAAPTKETLLFVTV